jgi:hypothetical protein
MEPWQWISHVFAVMGGAGGAYILPFILKLKQQSVDERKTIAMMQGERIAALESRVEGLHKENAECLKAQIDLRVEIGVLQRLIGQPILTPPSPVKP